MRILIVIPSLGFGGAERLLITLIPKLIERNCSVEICIFNGPNDLGKELENYDVKIHNLNLSHRWAVIETIKKLRKIIDVFKPQVMWGHLYFGILYSRIVSLFYKKIKVVSVLHYSISSDSHKSGLWYKFRNSIFKISQKLDYKTVAVSKSIKEDYQNFFQWKDIDVIYNAIDLKKIDRSTQMTDVEKKNLKLEFLSKKDQYLVSLPGRLHESKGHKYLIEAKEILKRDFNLDIRLVFIGDGPNKDALHNMVKNLDDVVFMGNIPQDELFKILKVSDFIVIPSLFEAFGLAAVEAMYLEQPVITTKVDGLLEITTNGLDAMQVEVKNSKDIAIALRNLIQDDLKRIEISQNARETASSFDSDFIASKWYKIFNGDNI